MPVKGATTIYGGSAVGDDATGLARQLVAADPFRGFAVAKAANVADPNKPGFTINGIALGADQAINVGLRIEGIIEVAAITGASGIGDIDKDVYMSDGNTFTLTSTSNTRIGRTLYYLNGVFGIYFKASAAHSA